MTIDELRGRGKGGGNSAFCIRHSSFVIRHSSSGIALVIVLGFLVLITVLIVAYFTSVTAESAAAKTYTNGASAKFLADSAVNIVMGQIANATQGVVPGSTSRMTWASQPGMIRTYDDTGAADNCYKLYSSPCMVIQSSTVQQAMAADVPQGWNREPALYTDLNAPVADASGNANFPIMDGNNITKMTVSGSSVWTYNSSGGSTPDIEGFYVQPSYNLNNYNNSNSLSATNNPVPMPVQWLYLLKDGTIIPPDPISTSGSTATFIHAAAQPSSTNPITGRIAFWTDDETCKLNINTASEGSPYAFPHTNTPTDMGSTAKTSPLKTSGTYGYAVSPPASGEYNRYPGHPATTCLSVAMGNWLNVNTTGTAAPTAFSSTANDNAYLANLGLNSLQGYLELTPRYLFGGSQAGTVPAADITGSANNPAYQLVASGSNRLLASFDELVFQPTRSQFPVLSKSALEELKFFLTASSRAPELTPFNTPKMSMWPQWYETSQRLAPAGSWAPPGLKAADALLGYCSSFGSNGGNSQSDTSGGSDALSGKNLYFFQRSYIPPPYSAVIGWRSAYYDWDDIARNRKLANYLYNLGSTPIPGYGASLESKYTKTSFSSLIIQSLDTIRSKSDMADFYTQDGTPAYAGANNFQFVEPLVMTGTGPDALPTNTGTTNLRGFGNRGVCTQIAIGAQVSTSGSTFTPYIYIETFNPSQAVPNNGGGYEFTIAPAENLFSTSMVTGTLTCANGNPGTSMTYDSRYRGYEFTPAPIKVFPYTLPVCTTSPDSSTITIGTGKPVVFTFYDNPGYPIQTMTVTFPAVIIAKPPAGASGDPVGLLNQSYFLSRGIECGATGNLRGDWRLLESLYDASGCYNPSNANPLEPDDYHNTNYTQVHTLRYYAGGDMVQETGTSEWLQPICVDGTSGCTTTGTATAYIAGTLVSATNNGLNNTDYEDDTAPCVPCGLQGAMMTAAKGQLVPGDWDTGPGLDPDGPYVNPTEEWNIAGDYQYFTQFSGDGSQWNSGNNEGGWLFGNGLNGTTSLTFSPNRLVSSPVRFGSLATGADPDNPKPWQTLLFCPNPAGRTTSAKLWPTIQDHVGFGNQPAFGAQMPYSPPDSIYLQFFTMPVVQPYAISEPFSTAGKVNLNYQLAPFTGIERSTALRGVFKSTLINAISPADVKGLGAGDHPTALPDLPKYKFNGQGMTSRYPDETHYNINRDATIAGIEEHYFANGMLFRYPSEICNLFLVPQWIYQGTYNTTGMPLAMINNSSYDNMMTWWSYKTLTGDNLREEPYDRIYPRLTTQSNTYTVHYRVQILQKSRNSDPSVWQEGQDVVASEYRGSSLIERYIDPNDPKLTANWDSATIALNFNLNAGSSKDATADLSQLYKFRVISTKKFAP